MSATPGKKKKKGREHVKHAAVLPGKGNFDGCSNSETQAKLNTRKAIEKKFVICIMLCPFLLLLCK